VVLYLPLHYSALEVVLHDYALYKSTFSLLYSNTVIGTLAIDGTFGTAKRVLGRLQPAKSCQSVPSSLYHM